MTDSTDEKPTPRQHRLSPQKEDFDFDLVDTSAIPDPANPTEQIADDEKAVNTNQQSSKPNRFAATESLMPPAKIVPEIKTNFYVDYFDKRKKAKAANSKPALVVDDVDPSSTIDNRSQESMTAETLLPQTEQSPDNPAPIVNGSGMAVAVLSQFKSKQESINKQQEKLIQEFSEKVKTTTTVTYAAVFFGVIALTAAAWLGFMLLQTKSELSDLAGTTTALSDEMKKNKVPVSDMEGTDPLIDQLNEKVDSVVEQMQEVELLQNKVAVLEKTTGVKASGASNKPHAHTTETTEKKQPEAGVAVKATPVATNKPVKNANASAGQITSPVSVNPITTAKPQNVTKPEVSKTAAKPEASKTANKPNITAKKESEMDKAISVPANDINNVVNTAIPQTVSGNAPKVNTNTSNLPPATTPSTQPQQQAANSGGWTVNLASSNRLDEAKKSASSYTQKGVPVTISSFTVKNQTRYRLQVKGFKSKEEAAAYAAKAKDILKLDSVWINP